MLRVRCAPPKWVVAVVRRRPRRKRIQAEKNSEDEIPRRQKSKSSTRREVRTPKWAIGFCRPRCGRQAGRNAVVVDRSRRRPGTASGLQRHGNEADYHVKHFNWFRDAGRQRLNDPPTKSHPIADIRNAAEGDPSPKNDGGVLEDPSAASMIGHVFKLGAIYAQKSSTPIFLDETKASVTP